MRILMRGRHHRRGHVRVPAVVAAVLAVLGAGLFVMGTLGGGESGSVAASAPAPAAATGAERPGAPLDPAGRGGRGAASEPLTTGPVMPGSAPVRVRIPAIDVDSGLVGLGLHADGTMEVPVDGEVAGWYTKAPTPGELGPAVIAAHVDWNGERGVFYDLKRLAAGDRVVVAREDGSTAVFRVTGVEQYPKRRFPTDAVYGSIDHAGLRLITCGGEFDETRDSYVDNVVVYAKLVRAAAPVGGS